MVEISTLPESEDIESNFEPCGARCVCGVSYGSPESLIGHLMGDTGAVEGARELETKQSRATNATLYSEYNDEAGGDDE